VHLREVWDDLAPASYLEESFVRRIAGLLWRLRRIEIFERAVVEYNENFSIFDYYAKRRAYGLTNLDPQEKSKELKEKANVLGLLIDLRESPAETPVDGKDVGIILKTITAARKDIVIEQEAILEDTTAEEVRRLLGGVAREHKLELDQLLALACYKVLEENNPLLSEALEFLKNTALASMQALLPDEAGLGKITRYEAHLQRQLIQTMHELEAIQDRRRGRAAPLARVDLNMDPPNDLRSMMQRASQR
jgi:hypothetical protein